MHSRILHGTVPIYGARLENMLLVVSPQVPPVHTLACHEGLAPSGTWVVAGCPPKPGNVGKQNVKKNTGWFSYQDFKNIFQITEWLKPLFFMGKWTFLPNKAYSTHPGNRTVSTKNLEVTRLLHRVRSNFVSKLPSSLSPNRHCFRSYQMLNKKDSGSALNLQLMGKFQVSSGFLKVS